MSIAKPKRPENEDAFVFRAGASVWLLAVADGVSTCEKGQEAARLTLATLWRNVRALTTGNCTDALRNTVLRTHHAVRSRFGSKGLASLVAALVFPGEGKLIWASVGDSLVCVRDFHGFRQVNPEDVETSVRQLNSETVLVNGVPVIDRRITQGIGIMGGIQPNMGVVEGLGSGSVVCLASDGVKCASLGSFLDRMHGFPDLVTIEAFSLAERETVRDDTTLLVLRIGKAPEVHDLETQLSAYESSEPSVRLTIVEQCGRSKWIPAGPLLGAFSSEHDQEMAWLEAIGQSYCQVPSKARCSGPFDEKAFR